MKRRRNTGNAIKIIGCIALFAIVVAVIVAAVLFYQKAHTGKEKVSVSGQEPVTNETYEELAEKHPYLKDVNFTGTIKYMELYDYPFGETEYYRMNKELPIGTDIASEKATEFVKAFMTLSYKDVAKNPQALITTIAPFCDPDGLLYIDIDGYAFDDEPDVSAEAINDRYVNDKLSTEATFVTDPSLVYEDGYIKCRGMIELNEYRDGSAGKTRYIPAEVMMKQDVDGFLITGIRTMNEYPEFEGDQTNVQ